MRLAERLLDRLIRPLGLRNQQRKPRAPDGIVGDITDALAGAFVDLGPIEVNPNRDICTTNVTIVGVGGETATSYAPAMELLARNRTRLPLERIVTHRMPLEEASEAIGLAHRDGTMKVVLDPAA